MIKVNFKGIFDAILKAEFIFRLKLDKFFIHAMYFLFNILLLIWLSLAIEKTMGKVESNQKEITELHYENSRLKYELSKTSSRAEVKENLVKLGSKLEESKEPLKIVKTNGSR